MDQTDETKERLIGLCDMIKMVYLPLMKEKRET